MTGKTANELPKKMRSDIAVNKTRFVLVLADKCVQTYFKSVEATQVCIPGLTNQKLVSDYFCRFH